MKKRFLSLFLAMTLVFTMLFSGTALAQEQDNSLAESVSSLLDISTWAYDDLYVGDTYNIYPQTWYLTGMKKPITKAQLREMIGAIRCKLINAGCVTAANDVKYLIKSNMTVKEVLEVFYAMLNSMEFNRDIGISKSGNALDYMAKTGVFTGSEGELSLDDICTVEQACAIATRLTTYLFDVLDAASKGFLWEIKYGENTAYLLGSIHAANYDIYPFSSKMLNAFAKSDVLCVEADILNLSSAETYLKYIYYTDGSTLKDHVSEETYQKAVEVGAIFGLTEEVVALLKPWYLYLTFSNYLTTASSNVEELSLAQSLGIDVKFLTDAYLSGKPIVELENVEYQLEVLDSFSDDLEELLLAITLEAFYSAGQSNDTILNDVYEMALKYWHDGDVEGFMKDIAPSLSSSELPELNEEDEKLLSLLKEYNTKLLTERDKRMAEKIDQFLKAEGSTTYFIVVGSNHYIGDHSVIDILKDMGYEINQIK
jgi:GumN protein.